MKAVAITSKGLENLAVREVKEILGKEALSRDCVIFFEGSEKEILQFAYLAKSVKRVLILSGKTTIAVDKKELFHAIEVMMKDVDVLGFVHGKTFKVETERFGEHGFNSLDISSEISRLIVVKTKAVISLSAPQVLFYCFVYQHDLYFGLDVSGFNLSQRDYNIFHVPHSLNGAIAYFLFRLAELKDGEVLLNHYCGSGAIAIEAALAMTHRSVHYYRKDKFVAGKIFGINLTQFDKQKITKTQFFAYDRGLPNITATKKNAQIAGVIKELHISRVDTEWLDTRQEKKSVDKVIAQLPVPTKILSDKDVAPVYKEFFYQMDYMLKKKHLIVLIVAKDQLLKQCLGDYRIIDERKMMQGELVYTVLVLKKKEE